MQSKMFSFKRMNFYEVISSDAIFDDNFVINHKKPHPQTKNGKY